MKATMRISPLLLVPIALVAVAATVKISELPLKTSVSTNTFIEVADMNAVAKSGKYLLTNLAPSFASVTNALGLTGDTSTYLNSAGGQSTPAGTGISALTGDVTATGPGSAAATLANTAVTGGSYGSATQVGTFTVDAKGRLTAAGNTTISGVASAANWTASGTTNSLLAGKASGNAAWFTNAVSWSGWYNVKDPAFGAKGDGTTDDTTAIQAAINLTTNGGYVFFPPGRYVVSATLTGKVSTHLIGSGTFSSQGTTATNCAIVNTSGTNTSPIVFFPDSSNGASIENIQIVGNTLNANSGNAGLYVGNGYGFYAKNVTVIGCYNGFYFDSCLGALAEGLYAANAKNCGIWCSGGQGNAFVRCQVTVCARYNVVMDGCSALSWFGSFIDDTSAGQYTLYLLGCSYCHFTDCYIGPTGAGTNLIIDSNSSYCSFTDCLIASQGGSSVLMIDIRGSNHSFINTVTTFVSGTKLSDTSTGTVYVNFDGLYKQPGFLANPTATIGNSAVNGTANTAMRSDAAPALPTTLQHYNGTDTNAILAAIGGAALASPALTGTPTINGQSVETQLTNKVDKTITALQTMAGPLALTDLLSGGYSVTRATLTHAGTVTLDCGITNRYASLTLTGNVMFATANLSAGKWYNVVITMTATNDTPTFPAWKWLGGAPSTLTASQIGVLSIYPQSTTDASTLAAYTETQ